MKAKLLWVALAVSFVLVPGSNGQRQAAEVKLHVHQDQPGPEIDRHIYGQFAEHLGRGIYDGIWVGEKSTIPNIQGYRTDVVHALQHIHVPVIRWPGGCFGETYDWRDGIGPRSQRPVRASVTWPHSTESNAFGTHEFLNFAELLGADAYVSGNIGSMPPRAMQQWIEYMTSPEDSTLAEERRSNGRDKPWKVKYFGIGNETWGCGGHMTPEYAADVTARYATFATTPEPDTPVRVASGPGEPGSDYGAFTEALMKRSATFQALSMHYYAMPLGKPKEPALGFSEEQWAAELDLARGIEKPLDDTIAAMDRYDPTKKISLFVDEWGSWYRRDPQHTPESHYQQNSIRDAEVAALSLDIFQRHTDRIRMANVAQMVNVLQCLIITDKDRMVLTPTYHVFDMYQPFMGATPFPVTVAGPEYVNGEHQMPMVDASAAKGKDGALYLALVNTDPRNAAHIKTDLQGSATGRILSGATMDAHNDFDHPAEVVPRGYTGRSEGGHVVFDLPAMSVAVVRIR